MSGYVLESKSGKLITETYSTDKKDCWVRSFNYLVRFDWMKPFAYKWAESIAEAKERGWKIVPARVVKK